MPEGITIEKLDPAAIDLAAGERGNGVGSALMGVGGR